MPLMKKKKLFGHEVDGNTGNQVPADSLAIAYGMKKKAKKYAKGGDVDYDSEHKRRLGESQDVLGHKKGAVSSGGHLKAAVREEGYAKSGNASYPSIHKSIAKDHRREAAEKHGEKLQTIYDMPNPKLKGLAEGGDVMLDLPAKKSEPLPQEHEDMVDRILSKCMSKGGMVSNEQGEHADEMPNEFDDLALRDDLDFDFNAANSGDELGSDLNQEDKYERMLRKRGK